MQNEGSVVMTASANRAKRALRLRSQPAEALITMLLVLFGLSMLKLR